MQRKTKNIISVCLIIVIVTLMGLTTYFGIKATKENNESVMSGNMPSQNNGSMNENSQTENNQGMGTPPEKPDGDTSNNTPPEKPEGEEENSTPPEKPDESSGNVSDNTNESTDNNMGTPPSMGDNKMPSMPASTNNETKTVATFYICSFGVLSVLLMSIILYLILSHLNEKKMKETFYNKDKITIYTLSIILLSILSTFTWVVVTNNYLTSSSANSNTEMNGPSGNNVGNVTYESVKEITSDERITEGEYTSTSESENAILVTGEQETTLENITVSKTGDSNGGDSTSFYGNNSAILAKDRASLTLRNINVTTDATGANGVFSYGGSATTNNENSDGTTINISDSTITTSKDNSGGIMVTGGGYLNATNLKIKTSGTSSAAIRSDRGGGVMTVNKGTYETSGKGSPAIYSTADITVSNATLTSSASEGVVIEGKNKVSLDNVTLTDTNSSLNGLSTTYKNIFIYQSMSGDAKDGAGEFTAKNSKITTNKGDTFYITNTTAIINLTNNTIVNNDKTGYFLRVQKDSWGNSGQNGGVVTLNLTNQKASGNIYVDSISTLTINMSDSSYFEGAINEDNTAKEITLKLDKTSKIKLTGDTYVTTLENELTDNSNIDFNGYTLYVNNKALS